MNINRIGIFDNTVIVDSNLFDDVNLLQTGLSALSDTFFSVVEGLPYQYANLTAFTTLSELYMLGLLFAATGLGVMVGYTKEKMTAAGKGNKAVVDPKP